MTGGMEALNPATELAGMGAILLFLNAFWRRRVVRWGRNSAFLGVLLLGGIAVYSHDVMNLPEICGLGVIGCAVGLMLAREWPAGHLPSLLAGAVGLTGLAAVIAALGALRNPHAFGLLDDLTDRMMPGATGAMALVLMLGAMAGGGGVGVICREAGFRGQAWLGSFLLVTASMATAYFMNAPRGAGAGMTIGFAFLSGMILIPCTMQAGVAVALAIICGIAGWSVVAMGFLLQDLGMVVAGGLAGSMGSTIALRLLRPVAKGLADSGSGA